MENLWAPWRMDYILGTKPDSCVFCLQNTDKTSLSDDDIDRMVLHRGSSCFVIMNKYPYNSGHIMVAPYAHLSCITELPTDAMVEMTNLVQISSLILRKYCNPQGLNVGINIGSAAGAGIKEHIHCHIVPRWNGDANFMAVLSEVRTVPQHITETYRALKMLFDNFSIYSKEIPCASSK